MLTSLNFAREPAFVVAVAIYTGCPTVAAPPWLPDRAVGQGSLRQTTIIHWLGFRRDKRTPQMWGTDLEQVIHCEFGALGIPPVGPSARRIPTLKHLVLSTAAVHLL